MTIDLIGPTLVKSNIKQMQVTSSKSIEEQSYQDSRQRNQAQTMIRDIWEVRVRFCKVY